MAYTRRLYKSSDDKIISGVSGGMAEYFEIDPVFIRLGWTASVFLTGGISILVYIVMVLVVPKRGHDSPPSPGGIIDKSGQAAERPIESEANMRERNEGKRHILGIGLVVAGIALLMYNLGFFGAIDWGIVAAISVIGIGAALIYTSARQRR